MAIESKYGIGGTTPADEAMAAGNAKRVTLRFDESTTFFDYEYFGKADRLILESGRDDATPTDNVFFFDLNDREFAGHTRQMMVDARALGGALTKGGSEEIAFVGTTHVTDYTVRFFGGDGGDRFQSGAGGDTLKMGGGDDYVSIGAGDDLVKAGGGDDYLESTDGDLTAADSIDGGDGDDELTFYGQSLTDADMAKLRSVEILGVSGGGSLELGANAALAGVRELYVDAFQTQTVTVGAAFTGSLLIHHQGAGANAMTFDASQSSATVTIEAGYDSTVSAPTYVGGMGAEDTIKVSNGYVFEGSPPHGGDLSNVTGFEHVVVEDLGGDSGAYLVLATQAGDIAAAYQTVDASGLGAGKSFELRASGATADLHVASGAADDLLTSGRGDDRIDGGLGGDTITGGLGNDAFVYAAAADSNGAVIDAILDFQSGKDTIDVTGIGADLPSLSGDLIHFFGNARGGNLDRQFAKTGHNGRLDVVYDLDHHTLWFDLNDNGRFDTTDLHIAMGSVHKLAAADVLDGHLIV